MKELLGYYIPFHSIYISKDRSYISFKNGDADSFKINGIIENIINIENLWGWPINEVIFKDIKIDYETSNILWGYFLETESGAAQINIRTKNNNETKLSCEYLEKSTIEQGNKIYYKDYPRQFTYTYFLKSTELCESYIELYPYEFIFDANIFRDDIPDLR